MEQPIYLDYSATTPCDPAVLDEMMPYFSATFGNPHSLHDFGMVAAKALEEARERVASIINSESNEIVFTSGATEANSVVINRVVAAKKCGFATLATEHKSVLDCVANLRASGVDVRLLPVKNDGLLDLEHLDNVLGEARERIGLLSICMINNETGVLQDIAKIAEICKKHDVLLHTDATQAFGKIQIDVRALNIDFLSASGHKIYGPKGIGALFCKRECANLLRVLHANHEVEFGIRSGTVPVPLCVGMGAAAKIASNELADNLVRIGRLRTKLVDGITQQLEEVYINGSESSNYPGIINISLRGCEGEALMMECQRIAVSSGSACTSNRLSISHVLEAMGVPPDIAQSSLRISIGRSTSDGDIAVAVNALVAAARKLRSMSPVWDMIKSNVDIDSVFADRCQVRHAI